MRASRHAGVRSEACARRHAPARPPPSCTPEQNFWKSPLHLDRNTIASCRGESVVVAAAAAVPDGGALLAAAAAAVGALLAVVAALEPPVAGASAARQPAETWSLCCTRHCSESFVPGGTLAQTFW